jgi:hypothetical protein
VGGVRKEERERIRQREKNKGERNVRERNREEKNRKS